VRLSLLVMVIGAYSLTGCAGWLPSSGPSTRQLEQAVTSPPEDDIIALVTIDPQTNQRLTQAKKKSEFAQYFPDIPRPIYALNPGDSLVVTIWEANPPMLFGMTPATLVAGARTGQATSLPEQMVGVDGNITVPFAGRLAVAGKTIAQIESIIALSLQGKANLPQVMVQVTRNTTSNVTVVGEVSQSVMLPLTPKGERVLDAVAAAGGVKQPVEKVTVQLARQSRVQTMPLEAIIQDPKQNIRLAPGDVLTAFYQPYSFTALGASGKNDEISFEGRGITLAQALGRMGGVLDNRADARGVFIFRFEDKQALPGDAQPKAYDTQGRVPVVYRLDLSDPAAFFMAQSFLLHDKDVIYVANAPSVELQKFLNILVSAIYPIVNVGNVTGTFN
jgi:polysaccharide export outer membrane protein